MEVVTSQAGLSVAGGKLIAGCRCCYGESGNRTACLVGFCFHILVNRLVIKKYVGFCSGLSIVVLGMGPALQGSLSNPAFNPVAPCFP